MHKRSIGLMMLAVLICAAAAAAVHTSMHTSTALPRYFDCPYSGPAMEDELPFQVEHYLLDINVALATKTIDGSVTAECVALDALANARFDLYQGTVASVEVNGQAAAWTYDGQEVNIALEPPAAVGDTFTAVISYSVTGTDHFDWKPVSAPETAYNKMVEASRWFPCLHDPRDKAQLELRVTVPDGKIAACNGMLQETRRNADRTSTYIWRERDPISTYLVTVNVSGYVLLTDDYQGIPCTYYVFPEDQPKAEIDFQNVPDILGFYESVFAPYPFEKMGLAETMLGGAMENQDMIAYGRILLTGDLTYEPILAHEISHMYWGDSVTLTKCQDTWLNEGFASYCEPLWAEFWHGTDEYDATMAEFKMAYLTGGAADEPVGDPDEVWSATVYCKGAWVLHMLRYVIGEEAFWQVMPQYYAAFAYGHATTQDFQAVAETVHGAELEWFFDEWVYEPWHPEIGFGWTVIDSTPDTVTVEVGVDQVQTSGPMFRMPLELDIELSMGVLTHTFLMERASQRILFQLPEAPVSIRCDPREKVLKVFAETTFTPTPGATEPPTPPPTFSPTATATPTETAAATETPVPPTETPTPACGELGVTLRLAADRAQPGEEFWIAADVCVPEVPLRAAFVALLDLGINEYWFYPSWKHYPPDVDYAVFDFSQGVTAVDVIAPFVWPEGTGSASGILMHAALLDEQLTAIQGVMDTVVFGYGP